ncbi:MAG: PSD1 and planctomycete cytochrome C domain-containing protein [Planctomycetaceae bacterium]|nr:PSD1 and planctomycete cytochrome C domain-containing protein [Planctomycetaceae bacterium]
MVRAAATMFIFVAPVAADEAIDGAALFRAKIRPLLVEKCLACHGQKPDDLKGALDLRSRTALLKGGESGEPSLIPGKPDESPLYRAITWADAGLQMPPKENDRLAAVQVGWVRQWILAGAPWEEKEEKTAKPQASSADGGVTVATSGGLSEAWTNRPYQPEDLWAYQPIRRPEVPDDVINPARVANPIDAFLQAAQKRRGVTQLAERADQRAWLRRSTFDLTGLPPTPDDMDAYLADQSSDADRTVLRRLLASSHYGEQQARHWLDVVRYADTSGFSNDYERPNAWRYRDYVVRSFNNDKPYNRFVVEQLAGDELDPDDPELQIAVGYLRMGPWEHTGMTVAAITRQQFLDDVTQHIGVSLLGQGLRCASCHDHKFDPVPTRDYYRIQAVFAPVQFVERPTAFLDVENTAGFDAALAPVRARIADIDAKQAAIRQKSEDAATAFLAQNGVKSLDELPPEKRPKKDYLGGTFGLDAVDLSLRKVYNKQKDYLERELKRFEPYAFGIYSGPANSYTSVKPLYQMPKKLDGTVPVVHILTGGSPESPADAVSPGVLSAMFGANEVVQRTAWNSIPDEMSGRRLALAHWIASPENTLTARVIVNRVWQQHFGRGLVATPNNFGKMGAKPSHPELLDWLATWFIEHDWSLKRLHELVMTSETYRLASHHPDHAAVQLLDSKNELLAYYPPRRLSAEELRDAMLLVSGELNPLAGGPGVFPELNWEVALQPRHIMGSVAPAYLPSRTPAERHRRTIYAFRYRTLSDPWLEVFNRPGSETSCERRDETTVTPQVFAQFNSQFAHGRAIAWANRLCRDEKPVEARIRQAWLEALGRDVTPDELTGSLMHYETMLGRHRSHQQSRSTLPRQVRRGMVEELTGEMVHWDEDLRELEHYTPDLQPADVSPETRALAEICLVLLNANEFLSVR